MTSRLTPYDWQQSDIDRIIKADGVGLVVTQVGGGKAQPLHSLVLTPSGFTAMGNIKAGQTVCTPQGATAQVVGIYPQGQRPVYKLSLGDGRTVLADEDHIWTVTESNRLASGRPDIQMTTKEILNDLDKSNGSSKWFIRHSSPVDLGRWTSSIDPYLLGLLLGDGGLSTGSVHYSTSDQEILDSIARLLPEGVTVKPAGNYDYRLTSPRGQANALLAELQRLGLMGKLSGGKFIPEHLLNSSILDRLSLLQGLLDSDGTAKRGGYDFTVKSEHLANAVTWLTRSLGGIAQQSIRTLRSGQYAGNKYHRVLGRLPAQFAPFRLSRQVARLTPATKYELVALSIRSIEFIGIEPTQCIMLDSDEHEYITDGFTRTHNTIVAVEAALGVKAKVVMVVAPQGTHVHTWGQAVHDQTEGEQYVRRIDSSVKGKKAFMDMKWGEPGWYICTPQWFARQEWSLIKPDMVIFDEIHIAGNYSGVTRRKLHQLQPRHRLALSGTPLRNKIENAWSIIRWIQPELMAASYWIWRLGPDLLTEYDPFAQQKRKVVGESKPGAIVNRLDCYIQHLQRENCCQYHPNGFLANLEKPAVEIRTVQMTPTQRKFYKQMEDSCIGWLSTPDEQGNYPVVAELPIVARGMLRFCALGLPSVDPETEKLYFADGCVSPKLDELMSILNEMGDEPALVLTHSQQFARVTVARLESEGVSSFEWSGKFSQKKRDDALTRFKAGEFRVIVAVISAIGTGTDGLQKATSTEIWLSEDDDPVNNEQGRGRLDRPGQGNQVARIYIQADQTYDAGVMSKGLESALKMAATLRKRK